MLIMFYELNVKEITKMATKKQVLRTIALAGALAAGKDIILVNFLNVNINNGGLQIADSKETVIKGDTTFSTYGSALTIGTGGTPDPCGGCDEPPTPEPPTPESDRDERSPATLYCSRVDGGVVGVFNGNDDYSFSLRTGTYPVAAGVDFTTTISREQRTIRQIGNAGRNGGQAILDATVLAHCLPAGAVTQQPPAQPITAPKPRRVTPAQPRRVTPAPLADKNVVMVVADMVENSDAMNVSTTFCDGDDPYAGQSVIATYNADSWDEFYQGRENRRERYGLSQLDLLTYNTDGNTAFFNGIEGRAIQTPLETRVAYDNDTWGGADVNTNVPMDDGSARMTPYEQELIDRGLMAALVHLDHLDHEGSNGVYRVYATLGQDILADDAQTVLFAEGSPAYLAEQGGVDRSEVSVNAPMFVNPEDATNARFSPEQEADMAAIQFAQGDMVRAMELDPNGFVAPQGDCGCQHSTEFVAPLQNSLGGNGGIFALVAAAAIFGTGYVLGGGRRRKNAAGPKAPTA